MKNNEELNTRKVSKLPIILIIILLLVIVSIICVSIFYNPPENDAKTENSDIVDDLSILKRNLSKLKSDLSNATNNSTSVTNDLSSKTNNSSSITNDSLNDEITDINDGDEWEKDTKYVLSSIESIVKKNITTNFNLNDLCIATSYSSPTNISDSMDNILTNVDSYITIGCYKENHNVTILLIPDSYDYKSVKKIDFIGDNMNVYDYAINGMKAICTIDSKNIISCK